MRLSAPTGMILANASTLIGLTLRGLCRLTSRLTSDRGGNVVMIFALVMPALVMITLGGIDLNRITTVKARVQDALDAATLAAARSSYTDPNDLKTVALVALKANLRNASIEPIADSDVKIVLTENQVVVADMRVQVKTLVANIVLPPYGKLMDDTLPVSVHSEVNRSSRNIEVALALDITGSMDNCSRNCPAVSKIGSPEGSCIRTGGHRRSEAAVALLFQDFFGPLFNGRERRRLCRHRARAAAFSVASSHGRHVADRKRQDDF